jgi:hypothetical protein
MFRWLETQWLVFDANLFAAIEHQLSVDASCSTGSSADSSVSKPKAASWLHIESTDQPGARFNAGLLAGYKALSKATALLAEIVAESILQCAEDRRRFGITSHETTFPICKVVV